MGKKALEKRFAMANIGDIRNQQRLEYQKYAKTNVYLPNPSAQAPVDRKSPQDYVAKVNALGLAPNVPQHFWELEKGDSGAGSSAYRRTDIFQQLAAPNDRSAETPYSKAVDLFTERASDQRPRYWHVSLFSVGRLVETIGAIAPTSDNQITKFASGIPQSEPTGVTVARGVPLVSTTKFRVMIHDESGQRFFDVDVVGTRSFNFYGFGVTVFALIKEEGYEINRQVDTNQTFNGLVDQSVVGARIIPIRTNSTQNPNNRTVTIARSAAEVTVYVPIPTGAKEAQVFCIDGAAVFSASLVRFVTADVLSLGGVSVAGVNGSQGAIDPEPGKSHSSIYRIPNANAIQISAPIGNPTSLWSIVFSETP